MCLKVLHVIITYIIREFKWLELLKKRSYFKRRYKLLG